jgi:serine/threonine-protein kinase
VNVPSVERLSRARAAKELTDAGLRFTLDTEPSDSIAAGLAIRTVPKEGASVQRGERVRLFVSSGPARVTVPDVVGLSRGSAQSQLDRKGLGTAVSEEDSGQPAGQVIAQSPPAGSRVQGGSKVTITVSRGQQRVQVPDVVGLSAGEAAGRLRAAGLTVAQRERRTSDQSEDGKVIAESPGGGGEAAKGQQVVIVVGKFKQPKQKSPPPAAPTPQNPPPQ